MPKKALPNFLSWLFKSLRNRASASTTDGISLADLSVPDLIERLVGCRGAEFARLGRVIAERMREVKAHRWLNACVRERSPWVQPRHIAVIATLPPNDAVEVLGVATLSSSGYTREAALHALATMRHERAILYVLPRLGDWVPEVRAAAERTLRSCLDSGIEQTLIDHHDLIDQLLRIGRVDLSPVHGELFSFLSTPRARPALDAGLASPRASTRLFCFRLLLREPHGQASLAARAACDRDCLVRGWVAAQAAQGALEVPEEVLRALLFDRSSRISSTVIRSLAAERAITFHTELLELALADATGVREAAQFALRPMGAADFAAECRSRLHAAERGAIRSGWVSCLAETGDRTDFDLAAKCLDHPRSGVRAAAALAIGSLDSARAVPLLVRMIADTSGRVRRAAITVLSAVDRSLWDKDVKVVFHTGTERAQLAALILLQSRARWDSMPQLLEGLVMDSQLVRDRAWQDVTAWYRCNAALGWMKPSAACRQEILTVWPRVANEADAPAWAIKEWRGLRKLIEEVSSTT